MKKSLKEKSLKPFIVSVLLLVLVLPTSSCISSAEGDLIDGILANVNTLDGEAVFHTEDGRTITITVTGDNQTDTDKAEEKTTEDCEDKENKDEKQNTDTKENLADFLPSVGSIEELFKTLGVWEQARELHDEGLTWAHTAQELGFNSETMYRELQDEIEARLRQAKELGLINQEQFEYKLKHYGEVALKYVNKIFADTTEPTTDPTSLLTPINSIEDVFKALGLWEKAYELYNNGLSWSAVATELGLTQETMYRELKDDIEERLHQAKSKGLISYEQYKEKIEYYNEMANKWVYEIFTG